MSAPQWAGYVATVDPAEAAELAQVLEVARRRRDDVARDLDELRGSPERLDRPGRLLQRVTQEALATELQLWRREVTDLETTAMLLGLRHLGITPA